VNAAGSGLVYSTYLGGSDQDVGLGIALDALGNAYVTGFTASTNFPTTPGAFQPSFGGGGGDAFVTKVNAAGSRLVYSTYLGGSGTEDFVSAGFLIRDSRPPGSVAVDAMGNAYVAGATGSSNFPVTSGAPQITFGGGGSDAFVTKLNPLGTGLVYSTYLGGSDFDVGMGIALDVFPNPNAYVAGYTGSTNFPTTLGAFQTAFNGVTDAFVTKIANIVLPPGAISGKVTGGGTINVSGGVANFGFIVQAQSTTGQISGDLQYVNHASGAIVHSVAFNSFAIVGNTATFSGTCTNSGTACTFIVNVTDNGEPGTNDSFTISVSGGAPEGGTLRSGNIQIHQTH
jgi:hypothetical protein